MKNVTSTCRAEGIDGLHAPNVVQHEPLAVVEAVPDVPLLPLDQVALHLCGTCGV